MTFPALLKPLSLSMSLFAMLQTTLAFAQTTGQTGLSKLEQAHKRGKMRRSCIALAKQIAPQIAVPQNMAAPSTSFDASPVTGFTVAYEKCLALADDEKNYIPDAATLKSALDSPKADTPSQTFLTIRTKQGDARIRVLNIKPAYKDKMQVKAGLYHIAIEKQGFAPWRKWLKVTGKHYNYLATLTPLAGKTAAAKTTASSKKTELSLAEKSHLAAQKRAKRAAEIKAKVAAKKAAAAKKKQALTLAEQSRLAAQKRAKRVAEIKAKVAAKKAAAAARANQLAAK